MGEQEVPSEEQQEVDDLRKGALSDEADDLGDVELVEHKGSDGKVRVYEVRAPTIEDQKNIARMCTDKKTKEVDHHRLGVLTLIACVYAPGTDRRIFTRADEAKLGVKRPAKGTLVTKLVAAMAKVQHGSEEEEEKNSEGAPDSTSSTP